MWVEESAVLSERYEKAVTSRVSYPLIKINGISKFGERETKFRHKMWEGIRREIVQEKKIFGISMAGIRVERKEISIDPEKLRPNVFYLFSYEDEKYVARKINGDIVEIFEVIE